MDTPLSRQMDQMAEAQEWKERAEAAEAKLSDWASRRDYVQRADQAEAEVERLREVIAGELAYRHTVETQVVELSAQANQLEREAGKAQDEVARLREALVTSDSLLSLVRHRHRNTPWPDDLQCDVDAAIAQSRTALALEILR